LARIIFGPPADDGRRHLRGVVARLLPVVLGVCLVVACSGSKTPKPVATTGTAAPAATTPAAVARPTVRVLTIPTAGAGSGGTAPTRTATPPSAATPQPSATPAPAGPCQADREAVRTLADPDGALVSLNPAATRIGDLARQTPPRLLGDLPGRSRVAPLELQTYAFTANVSGAQLLANGAIQVSLVDPQDAAAKLTIELPDPAGPCAKFTELGALGRMKAARDAFVAAFGQPPEGGVKSLSGSVQVAGTGFFSTGASQQRFGATAVELAPVISFQVAGAPPQPTPTTPAAAGGHTWYTSGAEFTGLYYCDDDPGWKQIPATALRAYASVDAVKNANPVKRLNKSCADSSH